MANNEPAFTFNSNDQDPSFIVNPSQNVISLGIVDDSNGLLDTPTLLAMFPNVRAGQIAFGGTFMYIFDGTNFRYWSD